MLIERVNGFRMIDAPWVEGPKSGHFGARLAVKDCFSLDHAVLRNFFGGAAFESYTAQGSEMNLKRGMELSEEYGRHQARLGVMTVTGGTPVFSFPYAAARGAHDAGGTTVAVIPAEGLDGDADRWAVYDAVWCLGIASGNEENDFAGANPVRIKSGHTLTVVGGKRGTNHEIGSAKQLYAGSVIGVITGVGGIAELLKDVYPYLNGGHPAIIDDDMAKLAAGVMEEGLKAKADMDMLLPFFARNLVLAGVPVVNVPKELEAIVYKPLQVFR